MTFPRIVETERLYKGLSWQVRREALGQIE